jgi:aspartyl-tRNA(Asn)/glutamyl-tRNA(Gln) amidotransferase subunit A
MTGNVADAALLLNVIAGYDARDSTSVNRAVDDYTTFLKDDLSGLTIGIPKEYFNTPGLDPEVAQATNKALETLKKLGAAFIDVTLPHTQYALATYYIIAPAEASANLARYDGVKYGFRVPEADHLAAMTTRSRTEGFGPEVQRRIILGTYVLSSGYYDAYYGKASQVRTLISNDFKEAFTQCDLLIAPVAPTPPFQLGEKVDDPLTMYLSDIFTLSANLAGIPAISVPCGQSSGGLPIGLQLMGPHFAEGPLLQAAYAFEQATYPDAIPGPPLSSLTEG